MRTLTAKVFTSKSLSMRTIIAIVDATKDCSLTVHYAAGIAEHHQATLYIIHVFWPVRDWRSYHLIDQEQLAFRHKLEDLAELARATVPVCKPALLVGNPAHRVSMLARDIQADLIIVNSDHPIILGQLLEPGEGEETLWQTPCPILICYDSGRYARDGKGRFE